LSVRDRNIANRTDPVARVDDVPALQQKVVLLLRGHGDHRDKGKTRRSRTPKCDSHDQPFAHPALDVFAAYSMCTSHPPVTSTAGAAVRAGASCVSAARFPCVVMRSTLCAA